MNNELFRNASGYADITAYKAIKNVEGCENDMGFNRGEIWEYETIGKPEMKKALVVSANFRANDRYVNVILLTDEPKGRISVPIVCEGMMYADCGMVSFSANDRLGRFIRTATAAEMAQIDEGIAQCLGLEMKDVGMPTESVAEIIKPVVLPLQEASVEVFSAELAEVKAEARIYKNLYEKLLDKMMG